MIELEHTLCYATSVLTVESSGVMTTTKMRLLSVVHPYVEPHLYLYTSFSSKQLKGEYHHSEQFYVIYLKTKSLACPLILRTCRKERYLRGH